MKTFLDNFSDIKLEKRDTSFIDTFPMCDIALEKPGDLPALLMVTGYVAKKTIIRLTCDACKQKFGNRDLVPLDLDIDSDVLRYFYIEEG